MMMKNTGSTSSFRIPFRDWDRAMFQHGNTQIRFKIEWPEKSGNQPNVIIDFSTIPSPGASMSEAPIYTIDEQPVSIPSDSFPRQHPSNMVQNSIQDLTLSSTNTPPQMVSFPFQSHPMPMPQPSQMHQAHCLRFASNSNRTIGQGQPLIIHQPHDQAQFPSQAPTYSASNQQMHSSGQPSMINPSLTPSAAVGQPVICQCSHPMDSHEHNCTADHPGHAAMAQQFSNSHPSQGRMLTNRGNMIITRAIPTGSASDYAPSALIVNHRPSMIPPAKSDVTSRFFHQTLLNGSMPLNMAPDQPIDTTKRSIPETERGQTSAAPKKRRTRNKSLKIVSPATSNGDQSIPTAQLTDQVGSNESRTPTSISKANSPDITHAPPNVHQKPSIRIVPEGQSASPNPLTDAQKDIASCSFRPSSSPSETSVRSPVSIDPSLYSSDNSDEHSPDNQEHPSQTTADRAVYQRAHSNETPSISNNIETNLPAVTVKPVETDDQSTKKSKRKPTEPGKRGPGRPRKNLKAVPPPPTNASFAADAVFNPTSNNSSQDHFSFSLNQNARVAMNERDPLDSLWTDPDGIVDFFAADQCKDVASMMSSHLPDASINWNNNCFDEIDDLRNLSTPGAPNSIHSNLSPEFQGLSFSSLSSTNNHVSSDRFPLSSTSPNGNSHENLFSSPYYTSFEQRPIQQQPQSLPSFSQLRCLEQ